MGKKRLISKLPVAPAFPTGHIEIKPVIQDISLQKKCSFKKSGISFYSPKTHSKKSFTRKSFRDNTKIHS